MQNGKLQLRICVGMILALCPSAGWAQSTTNCANQPAGLTVIRDTPFSTIPGDGWAYNYPDFNLGAGVAVDSSAPKSPPSVSMQRFPAGLVGGNGGGYGSVGTDLGGAYEVTYYCLVFKTDADFEQHPVFTKLGWFHVPTNSLFFALSGNTFFQIALNWQWPTGDADNTHLGFSGSGFLNGTQFFGRNQWVQIEIVYKPSTTRTSRDGYYCSWLNGALSACTNQLNTPDSYPAGRMKTRSTSNITIWGGTGSTKTRDSYLYFDHWRIAVGSNLPDGTTTPSPTPPPPTPPPPTGNPGTVSTLSVTPQSSTSALVSFTAVDDGAGAPAKYDNRLSVSPINWGGTSSIPSGACASPFSPAGSIGSTVTCLLTGLTPGQSYQLQNVAFRGTMNAGAVYGSLSNIASFTMPSSNVPAITNFTPASGVTGISVTISGLNFSATPANNTVKFNGQPAVVIAASTSALTVTVPDGVTTGRISIQTDQGIVYSDQNFSVGASGGGCGCS